MLFHLGPPGIKAREDRILSAVPLTNGSRLFLVARRTGHPIDAYEVSLFRVDPETNVFVTWLGYEDGYWWGASLQNDSTSGRVKIRAFGAVMGEYSSSEGTVSLGGNAGEVIPAYRIDGVKVIYPIPREILRGSNRIP